MTLQTDFDNYYIIPDEVDTSVGVEVTTTNEADNSFIVDEYDIVLDQRPKKRAKEPKEERKKKKRLSQMKPMNTEIGEDWIIENNISYDRDEDDNSAKVNSRVRRKNKKYLGYDFVT